MPKAIQIAPLFLPDKPILKNLTINFNSYRLVYQMHYYTYVHSLEKKNFHRYLGTSDFTIQVPVGYLKAIFRALKQFTNKSSLWLYIYVCSINISTVYSEGTSSTFLPLFLFLLFPK